MGAVFPSEGIQLGRGLRVGVHAARPARARCDLTRIRPAAWLVFVAAVVFFSIGAAGRGLWESDEPRIAESARVMTTPTGDRLLPHLNGEVYRDKPPLVAWIVAFFHGTVGLDLALAAKVPSIVGASLAGLATFLIGRRLYGAPAGLAAAV